MFQSLSVVSQKSEKPNWEHHRTASRTPLQPAKSEKAALECERVKSGIIVRGHEANINFGGAVSGRGGSCHNRLSLSPRRDASP
jgi:hypothetical protein